MYNKLVQYYTYGFNFRCSLLTLQFHLKKKTFFLQTNEKSYVKPPNGRYINVTFLTIDNTVSEYAIRILHCIFGTIFHLSSSLQKTICSRDEIHTLLVLNGVFHRHLLTANFMRYINYSHPKCSFGNEHSQVLKIWWANLLIYVFQVFQYGTFSLHALFLI